MQAIFERLVAANIQILPALQIANHLVFERAGFLALVERHGENLGASGGAGLLIEGKFAPLIWRGNQAFFVAKGFEQAASPEQVDALRLFQSDLDAALHVQRHFDA